MHQKHIYGSPWQLCSDKSQTRSLSKMSYDLSLSLCGCASSCVTRVSKHLFLLPVIFVSLIQFANGHLSWVTHHNCINLMFAIATWDSYWRTPSLFIKLNSIALNDVFWMQKTVGGVPSFSTVLVAEHQQCSLHLCSHQSAATVLQSHCTSSMSSCLGILMCTASINPERPLILMCSLPCFFFCLCLKPEIQITCSSYHIRFIFRYAQFPMDKI